MCVRVSDCCLVLNMEVACHSPSYSPFTILFSLIELQASIGDGSSCSIKMQTTYAIDKKSIWIVHSGSGPFANNELNHSEYNKVAYAEGTTSKQYTGTENFCPQ